VVLVEHLPRVGDVEVVIGLHRPGEVEQPVEVGSDHAVLRGRGWQPLQPRQLAIRGLPGVLGQPRGLHSLPQLVDLGLLIVALPELLLDRLQLLPQEVLALVAIDLRLDLRLDPGPELDHIELASQDLREPAQALAHVDLFQQPLLLLGGDAERAGDQVPERGGIVEVRHRHLQLLGQVGDLLDDLGEGALHVAGQRLELGGGLDHVRKLGDPRHQIGLLGDVLLDPDPLGALHQDPNRPVGNLQHPGHHPGHADVVELLWTGLLELGLARGDHHQHAVAGEDVVDELDRPLLPHRQRGEGIGEGDRLLQGQHRKRLGQGLLRPDRVLRLGRLDHLEHRGLRLRAQPGAVRCSAAVALGHAVAPG
jgi:hypothetical protein